MAIRIFKTRAFIKSIKKVELSDGALRDAVDEIQNGLIDAELGGMVVKKRVALPGRGKRGSARTIVAAKKDDRYFFLWAFEKNQRGNISARELQALREYACDLISMGEENLQVALRENDLEEIKNERKD